MSKNDILELEGDYSIYLPVYLRCRMEERTDIMWSTVIKEAVEKALTRKWTKEIMISIRCTFEGKTQADLNNDIEHALLHIDEAAARWAIARNITKEDL